MNESEYQALLETAWRRPLSVEEQARLDAWLAAHPGAQDEWETEAGLNQMLRQLPDAPLASNFTAQVVRALDHKPSGEGARPSLFVRLRPWFIRPVPRIAWAVLLLTVALMAYHQRRAHLRNEVAQGLTVLAEVATLSDPAALQDFEAIQRLSQAAPGNDDELFAVLNQ